LQSLRGRSAGTGAAAAPRAKRRFAQAERLYDICTTRWPLRGRTEGRDPAQGTILAIDGARGGAPSHWQRMTLRDSSGAGHAGPGSTDLALISARPRHTPGFVSCAPHNRVFCEIRSPSNRNGTARSDRSKISMRSVMSPKITSLTSAQCAALADDVKVEENRAKHRTAGT